MKIYKKLFKVYEELDPIRKDAKNHFQKYKYATLSNIQQALKPLLLKHKLLLKIETESIENILRFKLTIVDTESEEKEVAIYDIDKDTAQSNRVQACGSTMTYGQRYILGAYFGIPFDNEDPDTKDKPKLLSKDDIDTISYKAKQLKLDNKQVSSIIASLGYANSKQMPKSMLPELIKRMEEL